MQLNVFISNVSALAFIKDFFAQYNVIRYNEMNKILK